LPQADTPEVDSLISSLAFDVQANEQSPPQSWMTNPPLPGYDSAYIEQLLALLLDSDASFEPLVFLPNS
jgi:hypothetical protein